MVSLPDLEWYCGVHTTLLPKRPNHDAEYFLQSQASLFWPIRTVAPAYKKGSPIGLTTN
jgi:hypothetical protein